MKVAIILLLLFLFFVSMQLGEAYPMSLFAFSCGSSIGSILTDGGAFGRDGTSSEHKRLNRKLLKEQVVVLEDYGLIDPSPATKTSVGPKPIDHGSPLIPYIPQQPPPSPTSPSYDGALPPPIG